MTAAGGALAVFDGDYATTTVALGDHDPLQACADAAMAALVHDRYLVRRLGTLVRAAGWDVVRPAQPRLRGERGARATSSRSSTAARTRWSRPAAWASPRRTR